MEYFNQVYIACILFVPIIAYIYNYIWAHKNSEKHTVFVGSAMFFLLLVLTAFRLITLESSDNASYSILGLSMSNDFDFSISISAERLIYLLGLNLILLINFLYFPVFFSIIDAKKLLGIFYLLGGYLSSALCIFSEKIFVSIMFVEIAVFFFHAYSLLSDEIHQGREKVSYFRRNIFIFGGLFLMLGMSVTSLFGVENIVLAGLTLYCLSIACGRHSYKRPSDIILQSLSLVLALYIFWRIQSHGEYTGDNFLHNIIYLLLSLSFAVMSLLSTKKIVAFYWYSMSMVCGYFSIKMLSSIEKSNIAPLVMDVLLIMQLLAIFLLAGVKSLVATVGKKYALALDAALLVAHIISIAAPYLLMGELYLMTSVVGALNTGLYAVFALLISVAAVKLLYKSEEMAERNFEKVRGFQLHYPCVITVLAFFLHIALANGYLNFNISTLAFFVTPNFSDQAGYVYRITIAVAVILGALLGAFFIKSKWAQGLAWRKKLALNDRSELMPVIDPVFMVWSNIVVDFPIHLQSIFIKKINQSIQAISATSIQSEKKILRGMFLREAAYAVSRLSILVRSLHTGSIRVYVYIAVVVAFAIFLSFAIKLGGIS